MPARPKYFPALMYRMASTLQPVPVRLQVALMPAPPPPQSPATDAAGDAGKTSVAVPAAAAAGAVRLAIRATANPSLHRPLVSVVVVAKAPLFSENAADGGEIGPPATRPPALWRAEQRLLEWRLPDGLRPGQKVTFEATFPLAFAPAQGALPPPPPVQLKASSPDAQLSAVDFRLAPAPLPPSTSAVAGDDGLIDFVGCTVRRFTVTCTQR
ncbi:unnamed protein product [Phaeothamnion confervicola]